MNTKTMNKVANNFSYSLLAQIVTVILGLFLPRIILNGFGSEINGLLNSITQILAYMTIFEAGIQAVATKSLYTTIGLDDKLGTNRVLSAVNVSYHRIGFLYCFILIGVSLLYPTFISVEKLEYWEVVLIVLFSGLGNVVAFFRHAKYRILLAADGREYIMTNLNTITSIAGNVLKIVLLYFMIDVYVVIMLTFFVSLLQMVFIEYYIRKHYDWVDLDASPDYTGLKQSKYALIHQIAGLVFYNTDVILLTFFCDLKVVSVYSIYKLITGHIASFILVPFKSCSFVMGQLYQTDRKEFLRLFDAVQVGHNVISYSIMIVTYLMLPSFVSLYTQGVSDIAYSDQFLPILFVASELLSLIRTPMMQVVHFAGRYKDTVSRTVIETMINLICSIIGVQCIGIYGVLIGTIAAMLYRCIDFAIYSNNVLLLRSAKSTLGSYVLNIVVACAISLVFSRVNLNVTSYGRFFIVGTCITIPIVIVYFLINAFIYRKSIVYIAKNAKRVLCRCAE